MDYPFEPYNASTDPSSYNLIQNATILFPLPSTSSSGCGGGAPTSYAITWMYNGYMPGNSPSDPLTCIAIWQQGNLSSDGRRHVVAQFDTAPPFNFLYTNYTYTNLFTDYTLMQVLYRCDIPNPDGVNCDQPFVWVHTRIKPPLLTAAQRQYIQATADPLIAPIACGKFKMADISPSKWDLSKTSPPCNVADNQPPMSSEFRATLPVKWAGA
ncbi:uncharacterized protein LOC129600656 isoform X2 [Paramacrobiotus metropolitanus]|nr:uncharacterized protein LOC129600656 isoform X2 [Paramacrobiotus metropolitanus]